MMSEEKKIDYKKLRETCTFIRKNVLETICHAGAGHTGGSMSEVEILTALYFHILRVDPKKPGWPERDRYIQSKGHASPTYYCALALRGFFPLEKMCEFDHINGMLQGHPCMIKTPGVDMSTGSLGQGLSAGIGMALGRDLNKQNFHIYVLIGDGELQEGQNWEAIMYAGAKQLKGLVAIVDNNNLGLTGPTAEMLEPLEPKWEAFGWQTLRADGHDLEVVIKTLDKAKRMSDKGPVVAIFTTVKGYGVSFMENKAGWHGRAPTKEELEKALKEIDERFK